MTVIDFLANHAWIVIGLLVVGGVMGVMALHFLSKFDMDRAINNAIEDHKKEKDEEIQRLEREAERREWDHKRKLETITFELKAQNKEDELARKEEVVNQVIDIKRMATDEAIAAMREAMEEVKANVKDTSGLKMQVGDRHIDLLKHLEDAVADRIKKDTIISKHVVVDHNHRRCDEE